MNRLNKKGNVWTFVIAYFVIGILFYLLVIPGIDYARSTCRMTEAERGTIGCHGEHNFQNSYLISVFGSVSFLRNFVFWPIGFIDSIV